VPTLLSPRRYILPFGGQDSEEKIFKKGDEERRMERMTIEEMERMAIIRPKIKKIVTALWGEGVSFHYDNGLQLFLGLGPLYRGSNYGKKVKPSEPFIEATSVEVAILREKDARLVTEETGCIKNYRDIREGAGVDIPVEDIPEIISCVGGISRKWVEKSLSTHPGKFPRAFSPEGRHKEIEEKLSA